MRAFGCRSFPAAVVLIVLIPICGTSADEIGAGAPRAPNVAEAVQAEEIVAWSVDSGGGESGGGDFSLIATIGQPDVGTLSATDATFAGGLWGGTPAQQCIFCDDFESSGTGAWTAVVGENR